MKHYALSAAAAEDCPPEADLSALPIASGELARSGWLPRTIAKVLTDPLASNGSLALLDQALVSGTNFATSVIIGRLCSKGELGLYALGLSIFFVARGIQDQVVGTPYMVYCNHRRGKALASYTGSILVHQLGLSLVIMFGLLGIIGLSTRGIGPAGLTPTVWALLGAIPFLLLRDWARQVTFAHLRLPVAILLDLTICVLQLTALLMLAHLQLLSVTAVYLAMGLSSAIAVLGWFLLRRQPLHFIPAQIIADWWHNWSLAKWALGCLLLSAGVPYIAPWTLAAAHGVRATGVLAACTSLAGVAQMFLMGMSNYLSPQTARAYAAGGIVELRRVLRNGALLLSATIGSFCLLLLLWGDRLLVFVYGGKYAGYGVVIACAAGCVLAYAYDTLAANALWAMERPQANFAGNLAALVVTAAAAFLLIQPLGPTGAALTTFSGAVAGAVVRGVTVLRLFARERP